MAASFVPDMGRDNPANANTYDGEVFRTLITFGSSVITSVAGMGVAIARNSAGNYTYTLPQAYQNVLDISHSWLCATGVAPSFVVRTNTAGNSPQGTIVFETLVSGSAADPTSGQQLWLSIVVSRSGSNARYGW